MYKAANGVYRYVKFRPGLFEFLRDVSQFYELCLYTHSTRDVTERILALLREEGKLFTTVITRTDTNKPKKKLKYVKNKLPEDMRDRPIMIVDDNVHDVWMLSDHEKSNFIGIQPYFYFCQMLKRREKRRAISLSCLTEEAGLTTLGHKRSASQSAGRKVSTEIVGEGEWGPCRVDQELMRTKILLYSAAVDYFQK